MARLPLPRPPHPALPRPVLAFAAALVGSLLLLALLAIGAQQRRASVVLPQPAGAFGPANDLQACLPRDPAGVATRGCDAGLGIALARNDRQPMPRARRLPGRDRGGATQRAVALPFFSFRS